MTFGDWGRWCDSNYCSFGDFFFEGEEEGGPLCHRPWYRLRAGKFGNRVLILLKNDECNFKIMRKGGMTESWNENEGAKVGERTTKYDESGSDCDWLLFR